MLKLIVNYPYLLKMLNDSQEPKRELHDVKVAYRAKVQA